MLDAVEMLLHVVPLRLRHRFTIAHGSTDLQRNLIVELRHAGERGFGEASTVGYYGNDADGMAARLDAARAAIAAMPFDPDRDDCPERCFDALVGTLGDDRFALCALDQAVHDLWGRLRGAPVWQLLGLELRGVGGGPLPVSDYTLGIDSVPRMVAKLREFPDFPIYKIKLGTADDLAIVRALRAAAGPAPRFRIDANCAWTAAATLAMAPELAALGVEFLEQPLPADDHAGAARLKAECPLPVIADESCQVEADVATCAPLFHGINIKLTKCGGLTPARRMITAARALGLEVMVGCMTESTVGISAIAQLLPLLDHVDMDGALLLADDVADGVRVGGDGVVHFPDGPGFGLTWRGAPRIPR